MPETCIRPQELTNWSDRPNRPVVGSNPTSAASIHHSCGFGAEENRSWNLCRPLDLVTGSFPGIHTTTAEPGRRPWPSLLNQEAVLHVRFDGRSLDVPLGDLDVGTASEDREIKQRWPVTSRSPRRALRDYTVDRHETGNLTVRPEAVFG